MSLALRLMLGLGLLMPSFGSDDGRARYDNYRVYKVIPSNVAELSVLKKLEGTTDSLIFLKGVHSVGQDVGVIVAPHKLPDFLQLMSANEIENELIERNLQSRLKTERMRTYSSALHEYGWTNYYNLDDNYNWLKLLAKKYPKIVTLIEGGKSYENRSILGTKISYKSGNKGIFIEAGIHAREWISPATATYIINQLLTSDVTSIREIAENYDWYIFPHTNPDGYVYSHAKNRLWRKTRTPYGSCFGADPNRNWGIKWNEDNANTDPCSEEYVGQSAFSEIETESLSNYIASLKGKIQVYISFHSFAQVLLYPYGYTVDLPPNIKDLQQVADVTVAAIKKRHGTNYTAGRISEIMGNVSGSTIDWVYDIAGIKMAFCYELRPRNLLGVDGFLMKPSHIIATGEETLDSVAALIGEVKRLGYFN